MVGQEGGGVSPCNSILSITAAGRKHLVESEDTVALLEFRHSCTDFVDCAGNVITLVDLALLRDLRVLPVCICQNNISVSSIDFRHTNPWGCFPNKQP